MSHLCKQLSSHVMFSSLAKFVLHEDSFHTIVSQTTTGEIFFSAFLSFDGSVLECNMWLKIRWTLQSRARGVPGNCLYLHHQLFRKFIAEKEDKETKWLSLRRLRRNLTSEDSHLSLLEDTLKWTYIVFFDWYYLYRTFYFPQLILQRWNLISWIRTHTSVSNCRWCWWSNISTVIEEFTFKVHCMMVSTERVNSEMEHIFQHWSIISVKKKQRMCHYMEASIAFVVVFFFGKQLVNWICYSYFP